MVTMRKLQLGTAAVIANGLLALTLAAPPTALASTCGTQLVCGAGSGVCSNQPALNTICAAQAPAGCTVQSATCTTMVCRTLPPHISILYVNCVYQ